VYVRPRERINPKGPRLGVPHDIAGFTTGRFGNYTLLTA
jgi:hypothetical protein